MADNTTTRKMSREERYLKLLKGEISPQEFAKDLKKEVHERATTVRYEDRSAASA